MTPPNGWLPLIHRPSPRPKREGRRGCGAPRRVPTEGYACRQLGYLYSGVADALLHDLVADGHHGRGDRIQDFRCQAWGSMVTTR